MGNHVSVYWQYISKEITELIDPRVHVTKHMDWVTPWAKNGLTTWTGVEPDNYNLAICDYKPHDLKFIENSVFFRREKMQDKKQREYWISLYIGLERLQVILFNRAVIAQQPYAFWKHPNARLIREKRKLINRENYHVNSTASDNFSTEERLYQMGYYNKFKDKYFDEEKFFRIVGTPRASVLNYQPEVDNQYDEF